MIWKSIALDLSPAQVQALKAHNARIQQHLEKGMPLQLSVLDDLKKEMSQAIADNAAMNAILQQIEKSGDHIAVRLQHSDNEILNLPWTIAETKPGGARLGNISQLYLSKIAPEYASGKDHAPLQKAAPPLKILIMIAAPLDADYTNRLSYEEEEFQILSAFEPLMQSGDVAIDFTDDGSLEALERQLQSNQYHILHFSGHSTFKDGAGFLQLENPITLKAETVTAVDFARTVNSNPDHRAPMVALSSCQSAQGSAEAGIGNHLLRVGVQVVISMALSIRDDYATFFSAQLYRAIAEKQTIPAAFKKAVEALRVQEQTNLKQARVNHPPPLQWIIPNLYLADQVEHLINWDVQEQKLRFTAYRFITKKKRLILRHESDYRFIGRRAEKAKMLAPLFAGQTVLLKGQGGVGKTALAEYGAQRLIAANPRTRPFLFNETMKTLPDINKLLQDDLLEQGDTGIILELARFDKELDKFKLLIFSIAKHCDPLFIFDNLESFQQAPDAALEANYPGAAFEVNYQDIAEAIGFLQRTEKFPLLLTGRYPLAEWPKLPSLDLNQVSLTDFWRKCHTLALRRLQDDLRPQTDKKTGSVEKQPVQFIEIVEALHKTFGGNYRALEFFDALYREAPEKIAGALSSIQSFREKTAAFTEQVTGKMRKNLALPHLFSLLDGPQRDLLRLLGCFRIPVQDFALRLQEQENGAPLPKNCANLLLKLNALTLLEISLEAQSGTGYYYVTPIVRDMLADAQDGAPAAHPFSHLAAGSYHEHSYHNVDREITELEEAFFHYDAAQAKERLQSAGNTLSHIYYGASLFQTAFYYAARIYEKLGQQTAAPVLNRLGLILDMFGKYDQALPRYTLALEKHQADGDKSGEGTTLNNIAATAHAQGDYPTALNYLEQSLKISREIGDKSGEACTLFNLAMTYNNELNDKEKAMALFAEVVKINAFLKDAPLTKALQKMGLVK